MHLQLLAQRWLGETIPGIIRHARLGLILQSRGQMALSTCPMHMRTCIITILVALCHCITASPHLLGLAGCSVSLQSIDLLQAFEGPRVVGELQEVG